MSGDYDVVILGAGLGGLLSAAILAKEGMKVCVLEKNKQTGGCLQSFALHKKPFDSCVHYIGGLGEGHTLNRLFGYVGILQDLKLKALDEQGYDRIRFEEEETLFPHANGAYGFVQQLTEYFPEEKENLRKYIALLQKVSSHFPLYHLRAGDPQEKAKVSSWELGETLAQITGNQKLQQVLAGNSLLYAGVCGKTPFYMHALVSESYLHSAHKIIPASSEISKLLSRQIHAAGGIVLRHQEVSRAVEENGRVSFVETKAGLRVSGKNFIVNMAPAAFLPMLESKVIRPLFRQRIATLPQTISSFMLNLVLTPGKVPYQNYNTYWHHSKDALAATHYKPEDWPANYALFFTEDQKNKGFADTLSILTYMHFEAVAPWQNTENNSGNEADRGAAYEAFKEKHSELLLQKVSQEVAGLKGNIIAQSSATPLTYRDYTATPEGSIYGVLKDVHQPAQTTIATRSRIQNLFFTGQNINLHGVLGVSITAVATAAELIGMDYLLKKINT